MNKNCINEIVEMRLLTERMDKSLTEEEIAAKREELLCEMTFNRNEFKMYLMNKTTHIVGHISLVKFARRTGLYQETLNHWRSEIKSAICDFQAMDTKPKKGNREMVERVLKETWYRKMEIQNNPKDVIRRMRSKFDDDNIPLDDNTANTLCADFIAEMPNIINEMAYGTEETTLKYLESL